MAFDFLPRVDLCCGFLDLKAGSVLIAIYAFFAALFQGASNIAGGTMGCYMKSGGGVTADMARFVGKMFYPVSGVVVITALVCLVGIVMNRNVLVFLFGISLLIMFVFEGVMSMLILINTIVNYGTCGFKALIYDIVGLILPLLFFYFAIVVISYSEVM